MSSTVRRSLVCCAVAILLGVDSVSWAANPQDPQIQAAIAKGVAALKSKTSGTLTGGYDSLAGYALLKADVPATDPTVQAVLKRVEARFATGAYKPESHGHYEAGCDLMFLEAFHDPKYKPAMSAIIAHLAAGRSDVGVWTYPGTAGGDQSITQYAVLGMWAAERAEVFVPPALWDGVAGWQVRVQMQNGGFAYHPNSGGGTATNTMTVAGISNLYVARQFLYGKFAEDKLARNQKEKEKKPKPRFGVLQKVEAEDVANAAVDDPTVGKDEPKRPTDYRPQTPRANTDAALQRSSAYFNAIFPRIDVKSEGHKYYFWYGLERMASLAGVDVINGVNWYDVGAAHILASESEWTGSTEKAAFVVLFLSKATAKILGRPTEKGIDVGSGLLAGGRGLPEDLSQVVAVEDGKAEVRKSDEPLDDLFAALGDPSTGETIDAQAAIVEKLRLGDRKELIGQIDQVLLFVKHPNYEIRRTGVWVLGRTEDLKYVDELVDALQDENLDVAVEARNALCFLARKPRGLGMPDDPFKAAPDGATDDQRTAAAKVWQAEVHARWSKWADEKRPYETRDRVSLLPDPEGE